MSNKKHPSSSSSSSSSSLPPSKKTKIAIEEQYNEITLKLYDETITLTPSELYWVTDDDITNFYILTNYNIKKKLMAKIVVYDITYTDKRNITRTAKIPYYVSDGYSNHLRVNMLYPFMSFNIYDHLNSPYDNNAVPGLIFKYQIGTNINYLEILKKIETNFLKTNSQNDLDDINKNKDSLKSIFKRLANCLDYVIGLLSCQISDTDTDEDVKSYRPLTDHKDFNALVETDDRIKFDMKKINNDINNDINLDMKDNYRKCIIHEIRKLKNCFINSYLFSIKPKTLYVIECTRSDFNNTMKICTNKSYNININNYVDISIKFHHNIKNYIYQLKNTKVLDNLMNTELTNLDNFGMILSKLTYINFDNFNNTLNVMAKWWKTTCKVIPITYDNDDLRLFNQNDYNATNKSVILQSPINDYDIRAVNGNIINDDKYLTKLYIEYKSKYDYIKTFKKNNNINTNTRNVKELYLIYFNEYLAYKKDRLQEIDNVKKEYESIKNEYLKNNRVELPDSINKIEKIIIKINDYLTNMIIKPSAYTDLLEAYKKALRQIKAINR
jgi:hypothetical protein